MLDNPCKTEKDKRKAVEEIARSLNNLKEVLTDRSDGRSVGRERDSEASNLERTRISEILSEVTQEIINRDMVPLILAHLDKIEFESCKQIVDLFAHILRKPARPFNPMIRYFLEHPEILNTLLKGYYTPETAIHYGAVRLLIYSTIRGNFNKFDDCHSVCHFRFYETLVETKI